MWGIISDSLKYHVAAKVVGKRGHKQNIMIFLSLLNLFSPSRLGSFLCHRRSRRFYSLLSGSIHSFRITFRPLDPPTNESTAEPDQRPGHGEDDDDGSEDGEAVARDAAAVLAVNARVEERVGVEALGVVGEVGESQIEEEDQDEEGQVEERMGPGGREEDLEEGEEADEAVLGDILPGLEDEREPGRLVQDGPVDDQDEEREGRDAGIVQAVQGAEDARQSVEEHRPACSRVAEAVHRRYEEVEPQTPEVEPGEVAERLADVDAGAVRALPAEDEEDAEEHVEGEQGAQRGEHAWWEEPRCFEWMEMVQRGICPKKVEEGAHVGGETKAKRNHIHYRIVKSIT
ncbi:hypothetical protein T310_6739 [Rasamsonia emersonii CBS 393.64]|uniref:Uncharacterized protein n=1 Tax=Rasamsonia emersonii (strain ATCC 16479 / CBS 393.64 / IMI 116815) TaxID=1408163 RepID=A0A0F4YLX4_RASE3|nr:hypothetical protein T310_6739 [Rasamsonia emersonii CBS 393.64]KKA19282.1 hypothetical protein T310_6739 [Rasamsonia emersonii CBS 393.64]